MSKRLRASTSPPFSRFRFCCCCRYLWNRSRPVLEPIGRLLLRLLASICAPCRSEGWLGTRAPRVAMTTTIAPPLTEVLNRTLSATWPHMSRAPSPAAYCRHPPIAAGRERGVRLWETRRSPELPSSHIVVNTEWRKFWQLCRGIFFVSFSDRNRNRNRFTGINPNCRDAIRINVITKKRGSRQLIWSDFHVSCAMGWKCLFRI